jgi:ankyrin repeat protein
MFFNRRTPRHSFGIDPSTLTSALVEAAKSGKDVIVEQLLDRGADPNTPGVIQTASWNGGDSNVKIVQLLLAFGANPNAKSQSGATPLCQAAAGGHLEQMRLLLTRDADPNLPGPNPPLMCGRSHEKGVRLLLDYGANPITEGLIQLSAWDGRLETVQHLLNAGADPNAKNHSGTTAVQQAAKSGHSEVLQLLLSRGGR